MKSHVVQWAEWQVTVPFMFYLCITLDCYRKKFFLEDYAVLISSWGSIFAVFMISWGFEFITCIYILLFAVCLLGLALYLVVKDSYNVYSVAEKVVHMQILYMLTCCRATTSIKNAP